MHRPAPPSTPDVSGLAPAEMRRRVRASYDRIGPAYERRRQSDGDVALLVDLAARLSPGDRVLDAGCGAGVPVTETLARTFEVVGVDFSAAQLELASENVPAAEFLRQDVTSLGLQGGTFDAVCMYYTLFNVPREEHRALLADLHRVLRPGGLLLFDAGRNSCRRKHEADWLGTGVDMYWSRYDADTYVGMLDDLGFELVWRRDAAHELADDRRRVHPFVLARKRQG